MALDQTPPEFKHHLGILKHALASITSCCRRGLAPVTASDIHGHIRNIRKAADGLEALAGKIKEPVKTNKISSSSQGMTYEPENEKFSRKSWKEAE